MNQKRQPHGHGSPLPKHATCRDATASPRNNFLGDRKPYAGSPLGTSRGLAVILPEDIRKVLRSDSLSKWYPPAPRTTRAAVSCRKSRRIVTRARLPPLSRNRLIPVASQIHPPRKPLRPGRETPSQSERPSWRRYSGYESEPSPRSRQATQQSPRPTPALPEA